MTFCMKISYLLHLNKLDHHSSSTYHELSTKPNTLIFLTLFEQDHQPHFKNEETEANMTNDCSESHFGMNLSVFKSKEELQGPQSQP